MTRSSVKVGECETCHRRTFLTFHHLIPRKVHRRKRFQKLYSKDTLNQGVMICRQCHRGIHKCYDEVTLAERFNTLQLLLNDPQLEKHFQWVAKQRVKNPL
ncbi:HNH endonuclease [Pleionea litopenaei]|uniref:HNH endonuclease n=1 Tax=Pleionea litopenaei TaxID=3070815 RepID=A0AA51RUY5_9GAMM|nr:HNH endonuclease [Pleionea sp. HL-JVS1]WMS88176.1 HNH endonuclease [Pleionea sp. HL-JVS1]